MLALHPSTGGDMVRLVPLIAWTGDPGLHSPDSDSYKGVEYLNFFFLSVYNM